MARKKAPQTIEEPDVSREPITDSWRGETIYRCPFCPRDSSDEGQIREHIAVDHAEPAAHPLEDLSHGETDPDEDDGSGAEPDRGDGGDVHRGEHDG